LADATEPAYLFLVIFDSVDAFRTHDTNLPTLTPSQARLLQLGAQGLLNKPRARATPAALLAAIARMQLLQIDTINIVARSPYLVLFSRLGAYPNPWLMDSLEHGAIFECWGHEACFAPIADYALHRRHMLEMSQHWAVNRARRVQGEHADPMDRLLTHVRETGAVSSADFERTDGVAGGWWGWKSEKGWLEAWFALGELMIRRRVNFQRVYDLRERVVGRHPGWDDEPPSAAEVRRAFICKSVRALGIAQARWIADYFRMTPRVSADELAPLVASGELTPVDVAGWDAPAYVHADHLGLLDEAMADRLRATHTTLLSPFDPIVWDRARASAMFDFDYRLECYTPAEKRVHGYFVLPILSRGRLVGRLDAKAHRADGVFEIRSLSLESGVRGGKGLAADVAQAIRSCADWHQTPAVDASACAWDELREQLE
jgi:uncharacterized protein YcaQ